MAVRATFAEPANRTVNLWLDADSVRPGLALNDPEVLEFTVGGGKIDPYESPPPPLTLDQLDTRALNEALTAPGSILRAVAELQFGMMNGTIPVNPSLTPAQYKAQLRAKMTLQRT